MLLGLDARRWRLLLAGLIVAPWIGWAAVRGLGLDFAHPLVAVVAFTPWATIAAWAAVIAVLLLRAWRLALAGAVAALVLTAGLADRARSEDQPAVNGPHVTVMTVNVLKGEGDAREIVEQIRRRHIDVLALQELTPDEVRRLRAAGLEDELPSGIDESESGFGGMGLWSRIPMRSSNRQFDPSGTRAPEGLIAGLDLRVRSVHPFPPTSLGRARNWRTELGRMPSANRNGGALTILAGDFNATFDHSAFRRLIDRGYIDAADATGAGLRPTWPSTGRFKLTLDHILVDRRIRVEKVAVIPISGTDHRAVVADLRLP